MFSEKLQECGSYRVKIGSVLRALIFLSAVFSEKSEGSSLE
jgi:hypothetical protein